MNTMANVKIGENELLEMVTTVEKKLKDGEDVKIGDVEALEELLNEETNLDEKIENLMRTKLLRVKKKISKSTGLNVTKWSLFVNDMEKLKDIDDILHLVRGINARKDDQISKEELNKFEDEFKQVLPQINTRLSAYNAERATREIQKRLKLFANRLSRIIDEDFGAWIKQLRTEKGYSLKELEQVSNVTASYIHRLETGRKKTPSIPVAEKLALALGISPDEFFRKLNILSTPSSNGENNKPQPISEFIALGNFKFNNGQVAENEQKTKLLELISLIESIDIENINNFQESMKIIEKVKDLKTSINKLNDKSMVAVDVSSDEQNSR